MKILFDMGHPAHVHFFKNTIWELEKKGHQVKVTARDKDVTIALLEAYGIAHVVRGEGVRAPPAGRGLAGGSQGRGVETEAER